MRKNIIKKTALGLLLFCNVAANAQLVDVTKILDGGINDANKLMEGYMNPYGKGFAVALSNGWYNTAKPHKLLGFDITFSATMLTIPSNEKSFDVSKLDLEELDYNHEQSPVTPTIAGKDQDGTEMIIQPAGVELGRFNMPQGTNFGYVPSAMLQLGFGLPMGTEIMGRYLPPIKIGDMGKMGLWGVGLKHDIKQWIPVLSNVPLWSLSVMGAYTSFKTSATGTFLEPDVNIYNVPADYDMTQFEDQEVLFTSKSFTANLLVSTDIPIFNVYGGVGVVIAKSQLQLNGNFPTPGLPDTEGRPEIDVKENPINLKFKANNSFRANIGARLKLAVVNFHVDYTRCANYNLYTAGLGFSFR
jgi:hypothetical protein